MKPHTFLRYNYFPISNAITLFFHRLKIINNINNYFLMDMKFMYENNTYGLSICYVL